VIVCEQTSFSESNQEKLGLLAVFFVPRNGGGAFLSHYGTIKGKNRPFLLSE